MDKAQNFVESHDSRMIRKFGSKEQFEKVKRSHGLIPRGAEVGLDASCGYTDDSLSRRRQSSTLRSHRLVHYVAKRHGWEKCEELYAVLNRRHFIEAGILNDLDLLLDSCASMLRRRRPAHPPASAPLGRTRWRIMDAH